MIGLHAGQCILNISRFRAFRPG